MKKILLLLPLILTSCFEQQRNVADFKTGKFEFVQDVDGKSKSIFFIFYSFFQSFFWKLFPAIRFNPRPKAWDFSLLSGLGQL